MLQWIVIVSEFVSLANTVMHWCDVLGAISQADYVDRRYLSPQHRQANDQVTVWLKQAGCITWEDDAGNLWGRYESLSPHAPRLIFGSHLDTVPNGGKYDGMLGVLAPIIIVGKLNQAGIRLPFHVDIVGFGDEEGTRFGSTLLGSRALTGKWENHWATLVDKDGISLREAMQAFGLSFDNVAQSTITNKSDILGYVEIHIEQGPVLEDKNLPLGIVTAINGARRFKFDVQGNAGHAGTVPMPLRQDALAASAQMLLAVEKIAIEYNVVATVGYIENQPNGVNVISGATQFSLDIRSESDVRRDEALDAIIRELNNIAINREVRLSYIQTHSADAVSCDEQLQGLLSDAVKKSGLEAFSLPSGAGHDAMAMADICDVAMLFVRCEKGISHNPRESISQDDVAATLTVTEQFILLLSQRLASQANLQRS
jgi:allantoate deiminase